MVIYKDTTLKIPEAYRLTNGHYVECPLNLGPEETWPGLSFPSYMHRERLDRTDSLRFPI